MFHNLQCKRIRQFHFLRHCCFETYWTRGERHYQVNVHDKQCISQASKSHVRSQKDGENVNGTFESWVLCLRESQWATTVIWVCFAADQGSALRLRSEQSSVGCCELLSLLVISVLALWTETGHTHFTDLSYRDTVKATIHKSQRECKKTKTEKRNKHLEYFFNHVL